MPLSCLSCAIVSAGVCFVSLSLLVCLVSVSPHVCFVLVSPVVDLSCVTTTGVCLLIITTCYLLVAILQGLIIEPVSSTVFEYKELSLCLGGGGACVEYGAAT